MSYTKLLNQIIEKSGLTLKEIADRCTNDGVKITSSYISTLRNDTNNRAPSDDVSRAIAKACGCKHIDVLVIENYIDNAPESIKRIFDMLRDVSLFCSLSTVQNSFTADELKNANSVIEKMPLSELLLNISEIQITDMSKLFGAMNITTQFQDDTYNINTQLKQAVGLEINDDSMSPILSKGNKAVFEIKELKDFSDGDIIAFTEKDKDILIFRKIAFLNSEHTNFVMFPVNADYETKIYAADDVTIIGRVCQIISDI